MHAPELLLQCPNASLLKQWFAIFYDSLLIIAILFAATAILLPFNDGEAIGGPAYNLLLLGLVFFYYGWFWHRAGQTLGMKTWKIRVINEYGENPAWRESLLRWLFAMLPVPGIFLGLLAIMPDLLQPQKTWLMTGMLLMPLYHALGWHGRLSRTRVIDTARCAGGNH